MAQDRGWALRGRQISHQIISGERRLQILENIDLDIQAGESIAIVGKSGSGKTTLLSLLAGLDRASSGTIELGGHHLNAIDEQGRARIRAGNVGFVFQSFQLLASLTALENARLGADLDGQPNARQRARTALQALGLSQRLDHYPYQLSGGEQQRVAIARAFACDPAILFADEPTGNLDAATGAQIIDLIFERNVDRGTTLVLVTHDNDLAARCQRVLKLVDGRLQE
ncbi:MAG: ABC transporter ATP-binding protein [Panacagrimonas sp.]